jgi:hypothetical protein
MAILATMTDISWNVDCQTPTQSFKWVYTFTVNAKSNDGTVTWKDERSNQGGAGTWRIEGGKLVTRWANSATVERWDVPINTKDWHGTCVMQGKNCTLKAVSQDIVIVINVSEIQFYARTPKEKTDFLKRCTAARRAFDTAKLKMSAFLSKLGITYSRAFGEHEKLMKDIDAAEKLVEEMLLGFALAFVGGGVGGAVGAFMKQAAASDFMIDGVKDIAKFSVRGPGAKLFLTKHNAKMPDNPLEWKEGLNERASTELAFISEQLTGWEEAVENDDDSFDADFDPFQELKDDMIVLNDKTTVNLFDLPDFDRDQLQIQFQQGWLFGWMKEKGHTVSHIPMSRDIVRDKLRGYGRGINLPDLDKLIDAYVPNERPAFIYPSGI